MCSFFHQWRGVLLYVALPWFCPSCIYAKWPHFKDSKIWNPLPARGSVTQGQTLITLKINPSNGHDYVDTWEACFYTSTPTNLRGSDRSDASEACSDPGNVSSCAAVRTDIILQYICHPAPAPPWLSTVALIWVKRSFIRVSQSLGNATLSATHSVSAHTAAAGRHGNTQDSLVS